MTPKGQQGKSSSRVGDSPRTIPIDFTSLLLIKQVTPVELSSPSHTHSHAAVALTFLMGSSRGKKFVREQHPARYLQQRGEGGTGSAWLDHLPIVRKEKKPKRRRTGLKGVTGKCADGASRGRCDRGAEFKR